MPEAHPAAYHELPPRTVLVTMAGVMVTMLMAALDQTIVGTRLALRVLRQPSRWSGGGTDSLFLFPAYSS